MSVLARSSRCSVQKFEISAQDFRALADDDPVPLLLRGHSVGDGSVDVLLGGVGNCVEQLAVAGFVTLMVAPSAASTQLPLISIFMVLISLSVVVIRVYMVWSYKMAFLLGFAFTYIKFL